MSVTEIGGRTRTAGVIGWPVSGSLSPPIQNAAFSARGLDWVYLPLPVPPGELKRALDGLAASGFSGLNVTMPHKTESAKLSASLSEDAARLNAVNTFVADPGGWVGHNTDVGGFGRFLEQDAGFDASGRSALILGAGGAARACALALARAGLSTLHVSLRDRSKIQAIGDAIDGSATLLVAHDLEPSSVGEAGEVDLIINATPLGGPGEPLPLPEISASTLVVDLRYGASTNLLEAAREAGAAAFDGLGLLVHQAGLSFELWTGEDAPLGEKREAASGKTRP